MNQLPGRVIHIQMEGASLTVRFDLVPWPLSIADITGAIEAFNASDWEYFEQQWWNHHPHLRVLSNRLKKLTAFLDQEMFYSPESLIKLAQQRGLYQEADSVCAKRDLQRLMVLPGLCQWSSKKQGLIKEKGTHSVFGWTGELWNCAINQATPQLSNLPEITSSEKKPASL